MVRLGVVMQARLAMWRRDLERTMSAVRAEPSVVQEIRELPPRPAALTPSWLDVVEDDA